MLNVILLMKRVTLKVFLLDEFLGVFCRNNRFLMMSLLVSLVISIESKGIYKKKDITGVYCYTFYLF